MSNTVKFDPGMGNLVVNFNEYINNIYSNLYFLRTVHQKKAKFKLIYKQIEDAINNNLSFYLGCLLWAYYISIENKNNPKDIEGNIFLNLTKEEIEQYDYLLQVNFMENYFDSFERDMLYYADIKYKISDEWKEILKLYGEFLTLNKGFINTKTTNDILLPEKIMNLKISVNIEKLLNKAIQEKDLCIISQNIKLVQNA